MHCTCLYVCVRGYVCVCKRVRPCSRRSSAILLWSRMLQGRATRHSHGRVFDSVSGRRNQTGATLAPGGTTGSTGPLDLPLKPWDPGDNPRTPCTHPQTSGCRGVSYPWIPRPPVTTLGSWGPWKCPGPLGHLDQARILGSPVPTLKPLPVPTL